jgi:hypothetical protein
MFPVVEKKEKKETKWKGPSSQKNCTERNHFQSRSEKDHFHKVSISFFNQNQDGTRWGIVYLGRIAG